MFAYSEERKARIIGELQKLAEIQLRHKRISPRTLKKKPNGLSLEEVEFYFTELDNALRVAQLPPNDPTVEELIQSLKDFMTENGRRPTAMDASTGWLPYTPKQYNRAGGSWNGMMEMAGYKPYIGANKINLSFES